MKALWYISKRSFINSMKKSLKKPATYLIILLILVYIGIFGGMAVGWKMSGVFISKQALVTIFTGWTLFTFFSNFVTYAKKKGIIFKPGHAHFVFTAPIGPKSILIMGAVKNYATSLIGTIIFFIGELYIFELGIATSFFLSFGMFILEMVFEASLIVFLYANEKLSPQFITWLCRCIYVFMAAIVLVGFLYFRKKGVNVETIIAFADYPVIQMIPLVGWNISVYRMVLLGATGLNTVCSILYLLSVVSMFLIAYKMKCTGEYYEEAAKFADDYVEFYKKSKSGEMVFSVGHKKKFKQGAVVEYKATGAKAIFYRQLLEYKKERFFIFGGMTVIAAAVAFGVIKWLGMPEDFPAEAALLGILAYVIFCATGYTGKWEKELKNPYLYLIPDTSIKKLWYSTAIEHIRSFIDGCIMVIPIGVAWKISAYKIVMSIFIYVILQANKLYMRVFVEAVIGESLGVTGKGIIYMLFQSAVLGVGGVLGAVGAMLINMNALYPILGIYCIMIIVLIAFLASSKFDQMEQIG